MANLPLNSGFLDVIDGLKDTIANNINCHNIGRILTYNGTTNTATIEILQLKEWYNKTFQPTIISDVPIVTFGTFNARITMPNPVGCYCVLLYMDSNIDNFMETGEAHKPATGRKHSISDCIALLTVDCQINNKPLYDENALTLSNTNLYLKLYEDKIKIANKQQDLTNLIDKLLTACENIITVADESGGGLNPESKQAFTDLKTQFKELLQ